MGRPANTLESVMKKFVNKTDTCWLWTGALNKGYGVTSYLDKDLPAHRFIYQRMVGEIPKDYELDHLCKVTNCVNPEHLEAVTVQVNSHRSNNIGGVNARKTHCIYGHPFNEKNTFNIPIPNGNVGRGCRTCKARDWQKWYRKSRNVSTEA